jgi:hypothetical protein
MSFGTVPSPQPSVELSLGNFLIGIKRVIIDGTWTGAVKEDTGATLNLNPLDKYMMAGQYPGTRLGKRQLGESPELKFTSIEGSLGHLRMFADLRASVQGARLSFGRRNAVQTTHTADLYSEGPLQRVRKLGLYRVGIRIDGDIDWANPGDFTSFPLVLEVYPDLSLPESAWYGEFVDQEPT